MQYHLDCATLVLNAKNISTYVEHTQNNIGAFSTHVNDQKRSFSFVAHICLHIASCSSCSLHILFLRVEMLHEISYVYLTAWHTHVLPTLSTFHSLISKEIPRRRGTVDCASVPFSVRFQRRLFQGGNRNKKRRDRLIGWWCCWWNALAFFLQLKQVLVPGEPWPRRHGRTSRA